MMKYSNPHFFQPLLASILFSLLAVQPVQAQVFEGDLELRTQAEVDAFYYTEITGNLTIQGADITRIDDLSSLTTIGGYLQIGGNATLIHLDGLNNLTSVGSLYISRNPALTNINGLSSLNAIEGT